MKLLGKYTNGNYNVSIFSEGTKVRETDGDSFIPSFPESIDVKITNMCDIGCPFCHENSIPDGKHGEILNIKLIDTLSPYTEMAIGGGNPLSHPDLIPFLTKLKDKNIIASMTVNQKHFLENQELLKTLADDKLIYGIGVSLTKANDELIKCLYHFPNAVIHVINGVVTIEELKKLYDNDLKILVLGYKQFRRGENYYCQQVENLKFDLYNNIEEIKKHFKVVSFDNLAIKQLDLKRILSNEEWVEFYMGNDGQFTMYIDLVKGEFATSSISTDRRELKDNIVDMFNVVRQ